MTMREVDISLRQIQKRQHNAFALRASLHGVKIPMKGMNKQQMVSKEKSQEADKIMEKLISERTRGVVK